MSYREGSGPRPKAVEFCLSHKMSNVKKLCVLFNYTRHTLAVRSAVSEFFFELSESSSESPIKFFFSLSLIVITDMSAFDYRTVSMYIAEL